jgi:hypothetical protein
MFWVFKHPQNYIMHIFTLINFGLNSAFPSFNPSGLSGGWLNDEQTPPVREQGGEQAGNLNSTAFS